MSEEAQAPPRDAAPPGPHAPLHNGAPHTEPMTPLAALLVFVSTQKSVFIGGSLLFVYALGMGVLFFAIAGFAMQMPKSGTWMDAVKTAFGVIMIVAALYFLRNVIAPLRAYGWAGARTPDEWMVPTEVVIGRPLR